MDSILASFQDAFPSLYAPPAEDAAAAQPQPDAAAAADAAAATSQPAADGAAADDQQAAGAPDAYAERIQQINKRVSRCAAAKVALVDARCTRRGARLSACCEEAAPACKWCGDSGVVQSLVTHSHHLRHTRMNHTADDSMDFISCFWRAP